MRVFPKVVSQNDVSPNQDKVIVSVPIPANTTFNGLWIEGNILATSRLTALCACAYGVSGYIIPVDDPDSAIVIDTLWDEKVPKDDSIDAAGSLDLDTAGEDTSPEFELGETDISELLGITTAPQMVFERRELLTASKCLATFHLDGASPFTDHYYFPYDQFRLRIRKRFFVKNASYLLVGLSQPAYAQTRNLFKSFNSIQEWSTLQYLGETLKDMFKFVVNTIEAGAESPYQEAANLISDFLEEFQEQNAGSFQGIPLRMVARTTVDMSVQGMYEMPSLGVGL